MSWVEVSSDAISLTRDGISYGIAKYPIRKQWALMRYTPGMAEVAAYFRTEQHARDYAKAMSLRITDHRKDNP